MAILAERFKELRSANQQRRIADYLPKNKKRTENMSSMDVTRETGISDASIIYFSRAIGYRGFTGLKDDIYNSLAGEVGAAVRNIQLSDRFDVLSGRFNDQNIPDTFMELMNYNVTKTFHQNPVGNYDVPTDIILMPRRGCIISLRGYTGVTGHFTRLLGSAANQVIIPLHNEAEAMGILQGTDPGDIFIPFSSTRCYKIDTFLINVAKSHKARTCAATDNPLTLMILHSDTSFIVETSHMSFFNSAIGVEMMGEYIMTLVYRKNSKEYRKWTKERDALTAEFHMS